MAQVIGNKIKLDNGKLITPQTGGWYDGQQFWGGTLSAPGVINSQSNQQGAGQAVSQEVNRQSSVAQGLAPTAVQTYLDKKNTAPVTPPISPLDQTVASSVSTPGVSANTGVAGGVGGSVMPTAPQTIDLPGMYNTLYKSAGIPELEQKLADHATAYADAQSKINDNPWLSEATRTGRIAKLSTDYQNRVKNDQDALAMKKADIETQINLQNKQFDINSQVAKDSLDRFNTLLKMGSLDNASGEDVANLVRSTGLSSSAIQSAINYNKQKDVSTSMVSYDDGKNQGFALVNTKTGQIISKQVVAGSKILATQTVKVENPTTPGKKTTVTPTQERSFIATASKIIQTVDDNADQLLSANEYIKAVQDLMVKTGLDEASADKYASKSFSELGYQKWNW